MRPMHEVVGPRPFVVVEGRHSLSLQRSLLILEWALEELSFFQGLESDDRRRYITAVHLEFAAALVERAAVFNRNRVFRHHDLKFDAAGIAALPVLHPELILADQVGEVKA